MLFAAVPIHTLHAARDEVVEALEISGVNIFKTVGEIYPETMSANLTVSPQDFVNVQM